MTTHLSARLAWHDRGWDGHVCDAPHLNTSCIIHAHIRESRDDAKEREAAGKPFADLQGWLPPCSRDPGAYAERGYRVTHRDPLEFRNLPPATELLPPYSCCPSPYRWMSEEYFRDVCTSENMQIPGPAQPKETGWVYEPDRQRALLKHFWAKIEPRKSLIFYYCNQGNPLDENTARLVVGVGRIAKVGPQIYFGTKKGYEDQYPIWSRCITQDYPDQGVRIPYQEYLRGEYPVERILCRVPQSALLPFSYVGEHVSDDVAVAILERIIQSIEQVRADVLVPGEWNRRLAWLSDVLAEVWTGRGPFPGLGSVLQYLGFEKGTAYHRAVLGPMAKSGSDPWQYVLAILEGRVTPESDLYKPGLMKARERWAILKSRHALLTKLARFELSPDQVKRIADPDLRAKSGISASEAELAANPYILAESDLGTRYSAPVAVETIDHGMLPEGDAALFTDAERVSQDDRRRVRALAYTILQDAASNGDTVLTFPELVDRITKRFPERRACLPDREVIIAEGDFHREVLWTAFDEGPQLVALKRLQSLEQHIVSVVKRRARKNNALPTSPLPWGTALESRFGRPTTERARTALTEKEAALETLFKQRLSILTGGAGTGKTSVLEVLLDELEKVEGKNPVLLLAPTGKARVRLSTRTKRNAMTIHQFLLKQDWLMPQIFTLKAESEQGTYKATTVVIDECSMIPTDLLGTLLKALDMGPLTRLILVGDPNQLPPIGPGRPFVDIIEWLREEEPACIGELSICMRTDEAEGRPGEESLSLALADGYRTDAASPGDDEILAAVARGESQGDLEVAFWKDHDDLLVKLKDRMAAHLGFSNGDYASFNRSLGIELGIETENRDWAGSERWQILSPTRTQHFGTDDLNRLIQLEYKGKLLASCRSPWSKLPRPFGELDIVLTDKVIQVLNRTLKAWPQNVGLDYVANGEIGIVRNTNKKSDYFDVVFSTQPEVSYRYFRSQVDNNLELAYALTVHKAQGSDFEVVFLIIPQEASTLSRELLYTGMTRFRRRLVLLIEKDIAPLLRLRSPDCSATHLRNTQMFTLALRPEGVFRPHLEALIHRTRRGIAVRSKSEVIVADLLDSLGISYEYEKPLYSKSNPRDFRLPDFTVSYEGEIFYWEHLGMLTLPNYRDAWDRKLKWYEANGFASKLITSEDGPDGSIDASQIERSARMRILEE